MKLKTVLAALFAAVLSCAQANAAATLLPNGKQCFSATAGLNGMVGLLGTITGGSLYTSGSYGGVSLTGGSGSGATANITVSGGAVTAVTLLNPGSQYVAGDVLSAAAANIGGTGSGFSVPVSSTAINSSLAGGTVGFYIPNTLTFKQTWFNADQTAAHQNTNPVSLDANGCAVIYGTGIYRQILKDSLGNTVWDQPTADVSANNSTFWAGVSGGTPNVITVVDPGFNGTDGSIINFTAVATNTGPATLNPSGFGAVPILKNTTGGPVSLTGGEIVQNNQISVIYSSVSNSFNLLNTAIPSAAGTTAPLCGATGLSIANNSGTPNTIITLTSSQLVMVTNTGLTVHRSNVSLPSINTTVGNSTSTANGMDGTAPGTSAWLYIYGIDNGAAAAGLISLSATAPTLPSGYNYFCRLGAMRVDSGGSLLRFLQYGNVTQYTVTSTQASLVIASGNTASVYTAFSVSAVAPPTANSINVTMWVDTSATGTAYIAPNNSYGNNSSTTKPPPLMFGSNSTTTTELSYSATGWIVLESTNLWFASNSTGNKAFALGYRDAVNAN